VIVVDTNVLSELLAPTPDRAAMTAIHDLLPSAYLTAVTVAEITEGAKRMPRGRGRALVEEQLSWIGRSFSASVLPFTLREADDFARIRAERYRVGHPIGVADAMIAAICAAHGATLVTRNTRDFEGVGLELINPWDGPTG
jgi:predicted nucleic acid-binding protein